MIKFFMLSMNTNFIIINHHFIIITIDNSRMQLENAFVVDAGLTVTKKNSGHLHRLLTIKIKFPSSRIFIGSQKLIWLL